MTLIKTRFTLKKSRHQSVNNKSIGLSATIISPPDQPSSGPPNLFGGFFEGNFTSGNDILHMGIASPGTLSSALVVVYSNSDTATITVSDSQGNTWNVVASHTFSNASPGTGKIYYFLAQVDNTNPTLDVTINNPDNAIIQTFGFGFLAGSSFGNDAGINNLTNGDQIVSPSMSGAGTFNFYLYSGGVFTLDPQIPPYNFTFNLGVDTGIFSGNEVDISPGPFPSNSLLVFNSYGISGPSLSVIGDRGAGSGWLDPDETFAGFCSAISIALS